MLEGCCSLRSGLTEHTRTWESLWLLSYLQAWWFRRDPGSLSQWLPRQQLPQLAQQIQDQQLHLGG